MKTIDYVIIGAGVTGITIANKLKEKGVDSYIVLEKEPEWGGLCRTRVINGHTLDIGGGHFFNTKHQGIFDYVFKFLPKSEFNYFNRVSKIEINENTIDYPIESNIWQFPEEEQIRYLISVIRNGESLGHAEPQNYEEWVRWKLGDVICDEYMIPYNEKLWGVKPREMDVDWLYKIPRVKVEEVLQYCLRKKQDVNKFPAHVNFYYPKAGGFQTIIDALAGGVQDHIKLGEKVDSLKHSYEWWEVNGNYKARNVINTAPWFDLYAALGSPEELKDSFQKVRYNRIVVSLFEKNYGGVDWHWRYIPDPNKPYHREFYIHNFARDSKDNGIYLESNIGRYDKESKLDNASRLADYTTDAAYPIPLIGHAGAIKRILEYYKPMKLYGVGRWGQHEYQNADVSMYEAIKFVEANV